MTDTTKKARKRKSQGPFSDELLDQLLAQASGKDAERMLGAELNHYLATERASGDVSMANP